MNYAQWHMPVIPALGEVEAEEPGAPGQPGLHSKLEANLTYRREKNESQATQTHRDTRQGGGQRCSEAVGPLAPGPTHGLLPLDIFIPSSAKTI